jgi:hypothetical protein
MDTPVLRTAISIFSLIDVARAKRRERADHRHLEVAHQVFSYRRQSLENNFQARYRAGVGSLLPGSKGAVVAFKFDTRCNDSPMRAHMGIQSTIEDADSCG